VHIGANGTHCSNCGNWCKLVHMVEIGANGGANARNWCNLNGAHWCKWRKLVHIDANSAYGGANCANWCK